MLPPCQLPAGGLAEEGNPSSVAGIGPGWIQTAPRPRAHPPRGLPGRGGSGRSRGAGLPRIRRGYRERDGHRSRARSGAETGSPAPGEVPIGIPSLGSLLWDASLSLRAWGGTTTIPDERGDSRGIGAGRIRGGVPAPADSRGREGGELLRPSGTGGVCGQGVRSGNRGGGERAFPTPVGRRLVGRGGAAEYFYLRQVFDASDIVGVPVIVPARGHTLSVRPVVGREWGTGWRVDLELEGSRQWLDEPLDSFWDSGPRLSWVRTWGTASDLGISYRYRRRMFDDREPLDEEGVPVSGDWCFNSMSSRSPGGMHGARQTIGGPRFERASWRASTTVAGSTTTTGPRWPGWSVTSGRPGARTEIKSRWYLYPVQTARTGDNTRRRREDLDLSARAEWTIRKGLRVFAEYEFETSNQNLLASDYQVNSATSGVELVW